MRVLRSRCARPIHMLALYFMHRTGTARGRRRTSSFIITMDGGTPRFVDGRESNGRRIIPNERNDDNNSTLSKHSK